MANSKSENGSNEYNNGKERIEASIPTELNERLVDYASERGQSVQSVIRESLEHQLDKCDSKSIIRDACERGKLRKESRACKFVDRH